MGQTERSILLHDSDEALALFGDQDRYLRMIRNHFDIKIVARGGNLRLSGEESSVLEALSAVHGLLEQVRSRGRLEMMDVERALLGQNVAERPRESRPDVLDPFVPKTAGQRAFVEAVRNHPVTFGIGPAGTGKTFLATAVAVSCLVRGEVKKLTLVRPAVEAGEKLGFLPGDFQAKVHPYLRPIFDALAAVMPQKQVQLYMEREVIEVTPLAYMRGRTLDDAFVILDEAQNTTPKQMLMLLTRIGPRSKVVVTGDMSQVDLPDDVPSGLEDAVARLHGVPGIAIMRMTESDIVRHEMVHRIVEAYADDEARQGPRPRSGSGRFPRRVPLADIPKAQAAHPEFSTEA